MANIVGKAMVCGVVAATLVAAMSPAAFAVDPEFSGPVVYGDPYNAMLAATVPPSEAVDVRFSGRLVYLDPYNATLAATVLSSIRTVAVEDLSTSYAFAPDFQGPRLWEGPTSFGK
jgi:hypothetical protein